MTFALVSDQKPLPELSREKHILNISSVLWMCCLLLLLLLIIGFGIWMHRSYRTTTATSPLEINNKQSIKINNQPDHKPKQVKQRSMRKTYLCSSL
jgi:TRAP-type C4-dicarboxylate transport system permease small subunit